MPIDASILKNLKKIIGPKHVHDAWHQRAAYAYDASNREFVPDAVVFPSTTAQVAEIIRLANLNSFFVIPRGAGTGMTGGALAVQGGIMMPMTRMDQVLSIDPANLVADLEPGVVTGDFQKMVEAQGLFYPPDPSSSAYCTMGGNVAECAGGPKAVKYGVTRDYVLGLEAVTGAGEIIKTGVRTAKGVVGYDLTRLITGSEGTLAVITRITVRLLPLPESVRTITAVYDKIDDAAKTVAAVFSAGVICRSIEYLDQAAIGCAESHLGIGLPTDAEAILLLEVDGDPQQTERAAERVVKVCQDNHARKVTGVGDAAEAANLWKARKGLSPALFKYGPHKINEDIVVPRTKIPDVVRKINELRAKTGLTMVSFGHAGDGNIHFNIMLDKEDPVALEKAEAAVVELFQYTLQLGGTISGEHGVGISKAPYFDMEVSQTQIELMLHIKDVFDPNHILNPGKMFPPGA
ncbi:MAG: FAD-binding protein [Desulfatibacillum sp.]|nr:FAD-binding protein [Desulfatibacillum sp.]